MGLILAIVLGGILLIVGFFICSVLFLKVLVRGNEKWFEKNGPMLMGSMFLGLFATFFFTFGWFAELAATHTGGEPQTKYLDLTCSSCVAATLKSRARSTNVSE